MARGAVGQEAPRLEGAARAAGCVRRGDLGAEGGEEEVRVHQEELRAGLRVQLGVDGGLVALNWWRLWVFDGGGGGLATAAKRP